RRPGVRAALRGPGPLRGHVPPHRGQDLRDRDHRMRRTLAMVLAAAVLALAAGCGGDGGGGDAASYRATDMDTGEEVSVDDMHGRPVLLVSWATWCAECDELLGGLQAFADSPAAEGVEIVAVN